MESTSGTPNDATNGFCHGEPGPLASHARTHGLLLDEVALDLVLAVAALR